MRVHRHCAPGNDLAVFRHLATAEAARLRLRPILMTSFAFTLGVLPLVIAKGPGAEMRQAPALSKKNRGWQASPKWRYMRGMFTVVKVRENLTSYDDPGWYENPPGTLASLASNDELQRDFGQNSREPDQWITT